MLKSNKTSGSLYVVATPIGNLEDITLRALRILKEVNYILCEDKRITTRLLAKYEIKTKLISFHKFNEIKIIDDILSMLDSGKNIALVSDAGTPLISDPGCQLISSAINNKITTVPIPGPSALSTFLSIFPLRLKEFLFLGFLPHKKSKRRKILELLKSRTETAILFIGPHDFSKYLKEIHELYPDVEIFYARELTKIYEEHWFGNVKELLNIIENKNIKGEITLCLRFDSQKFRGTL